MTIRLGTASETDITLPIAVRKIPPNVTAAGIEIEHARTIRFSLEIGDDIRYVEVVDGDGKHIVSGVGDSADALTAMLLYLLLRITGLSEGLAVALARH